MQHGGQRPDFRWSLDSKVESEIVLDRIGDNQRVSSGFITVARSKAIGEHQLLVGLNRHGATSLQGGGRMVRPGNQDSGGCPFDAVSPPSTGRFTPVT